MPEQAGAVRRSGNVPNSLKFLWRHIGFICVAAVLLYCVVHAFDPPRLNWGDSASDYNVMNSGRNFQKYGFLKLRLTPFLMDPTLMAPSDRALIYTHYPQLPDLINGVLRVVFGLQDLVQFRFVALAFSFAALFFIYHLICRYWTRQTAQVALALWVVNPLWIQHTDHLHQVPLGAFFGFGAVWWTSRFWQTRGRASLVAAGIFIFFVILSSYDYWLFVPLLLALVTFAEQRSLVTRDAIRVLATLASCAVAAFVAKTATNIWVLGVAGFVRDLRFQFVERATNQVVQTSYTHGIWPTLVGRVERCFTLLFFGMVVFWALLPLARRVWPSQSRVAASVRNPILLLLAALPFLVIFNEIWVGQYYPTLLVLPFYAVASAALVVLLLDATALPWRFAGIALLVTLAGHSVIENARFRKAFIRPETIRTLGAQLDSVSAPGQALLINHVFDTFYRYYFNRKTVPFILTPRERIDTSLAWYTTSPKPGSATPTGSIFVQHRHLEDQFFDKAYYYLLAQEQRWDWWGNPEHHRPELDRFMAERDSVLMQRVAARGEKLFETPDYVVWRVRP